MKKILSFVAVLLLFAGTATATTLNPIQLLNPTGSTSGQVISSTGATSAPAWANVSASSLAAIAANSVLANVTGSAASPTAFAMPSCSTANSALKYTSGTGWVCGTTYALTSSTLAQFAATTSAQLAGVISDETGTGPLVFATGSAINPTTIGAATPGTGAFTTISASGTVSGAGFSNYLASPPAIGGATPASGSFSTLSASSTVSGAGFSSYLASPPAIGGTSPSSGAFTNLSANGTVSGIVGRLLNVQKFTASGTYTPTSGATSAIVCGIGGGAAGTGAPATASTTYSIGGGGGAGAFGCIRIASGLTTTTVTIGGGGTPSAGVAGTAGGTTSFGALMVLPGGNVGSGPFGPTASAFFSLPTSSGAPSGAGTFLYSSIGYPSSIGVINPASTNTVNSLGGLSPYGWTGAFGAGGNGASIGISTAATAGSPGTAGVIFVYEYQ